MFRMNEPLVADLLGELEDKNAKVKYLKSQLNQFKRLRMNNQPVYKWDWKSLCQFIIHISTTECYKAR